jgi:hypothetical protein
MIAAVDAGVISVIAADDVAMLNAAGASGASSANLPSCWRLNPSELLRLPLRCWNAGAVAVETSELEDRRPHRYGGNARGQSGQQ